MKYLIVPILLAFPTLSSGDSDASDTPTSKLSTHQIDPPQYKKLGIEFLHSMGLSGKGVKVGIIDNFIEVADPRVKEMNFRGKVYPDKHGLFTLGIIAGTQAGPDKTRIGIAPDSTIFFEANPTQHSRAFEQTLTIKAEDSYIFYSSDLKNQWPTSPGDLFTFEYPDPTTLVIKHNGKNLDPEEYPIFTSETALSATKDSNYLFAAFMKTFKQKLLDDINTDTATIKEFNNIYTFSDLMAFFVEHNSYFDTQSETLTSYKLLFDTFSADRIIKGLFNVSLDEDIDEQTAKVIRTMMAEGIQIINASFTLMPGPKTKEAIKDLAKAGGIIIKSAGNTNILISGQGIKNPDIVGGNIYLNTLLWRELQADRDIRRAFLLVSALNRELNKLAEFSARSGDAAPERYLGAWGQDILSYELNTDRVITNSGTSFAAPVVTGIIALLKEAFPKLSAQEIACYLLKYSDSLGENQFFLSGRGRINAHNAYDAMKSGKKCSRNE